MANYRLGPLGFFAMGENRGVPGNAGFRDQTMALKWVNDNIAKFGGDPQTIAIAGESAGSASIALHLVSPKSQGLFKRAILQSGTGLSPGWDPNTPEQALVGNICFMPPLVLSKSEDLAFSVCIKVCLFFNFLM